MSSSIIASSSLQVALEVLLRNDFSALDLPIDPTDPLWDRIEKDFHLTLGQLSALRNYVKNNNLCNPPSPGNNLSSAVTTTGDVSALPSEGKRSRRRKKVVEGSKAGGSTLLSGTTCSTMMPQQKAAVLSPKLEVKPSVVDFSRMSFEDFEAMDGEVLKVIDLTTTSVVANKKASSIADLSHDDEEEPDTKRFKLGTSSPHVALPQRIKEEAILDFMYADRTDLLDTILLSAGVTEEQYVQFPIDDRFINPECSSDDLLDPSKCIYL